MNLLNDPWMPVRRRDGSRVLIAPYQISDPEIIAFDADRPDFNGALAQFAIGLLQTTTPMDSPIVWRQLFASPPDAVTLQGWFAPVTNAFEFDGDGVRFMQDRTLVPPKKHTDTGDDIGGYEEFQQLLIECAGEGEKIKDNTDLFIKRKKDGFGVCTACGAAALYTLQSSAPGGGRGYLVSVRGGGPLTTLLLCGESQALWRDLWLNVREREQFLQRTGDCDKSDPHFTYPWLGDIRILQPAGITAVHFEGEKGKPKPTEEEKPRLQPIQVHPAHVFWAMPRRVRLDFDAGSAGECSICGRWSERLIRQYITKNYGLNYKGAWDHPMSPYYEVEDGWRPLHPQPGGFGYRLWLAWVLGLSSDNKKQRPARVVEHFLEHRRRQSGGQLRLWAFGYDMDNMKARCWYESTLPLYGLADCERDAQRRVESEVGLWLAGAEKAAFYLTESIRRAWFAEDDFDKWKEKKKRKFRMNLESHLWSRTEPAFYMHLKRLIFAARDDLEFDAVATRKDWHQTLSRTVLALFDKDLVCAAQIERQNTRRTAEAFNSLKRSLGGDAILQALGLAVATAASKPKRNRKAARSAA